MQVFEIYHYRYKLRSISAVYLIFSSVIFYCLQIQSFLCIIQKHLVLLTFYIYHISLYKNSLSSCMHQLLMTLTQMLIYFSNGTMLRLLGNNRQLVSNKPGETSRVTGLSSSSSNNSSSMLPINNTSSGMANKLSRTTPPAGVGPVAPSRSLRDCAGSLLSVLFSLLGSPSLLCIYSRPILCCVTWNL